MKPFRFPAFASRTLTVSALFTLSGLPVAYGQIYYDNSGTDWSALSIWSTSPTAATPDPAVVPGGIGGVGQNVVLGTSATVNLTAAKTINLNGDYSIGQLSTINLNNTITLAGGGTNRTLSIAGGIYHDRGGLTIGSTTEGQKVYIQLLGSQTWDSVTDGSSGTYTGAALIVQNEISIGSGGGNQTLTLGSTNTGPQLNGVISDGGGVLSLTKAGGGATNIWTVNGNNTFTGNVTINEGIFVAGHGNAIPDASKLTVASGKTLRLLLNSTFTSDKMNGFGASATYGSGTSVLDVDTGSAKYEYSTNWNKTFNFRKAGTGSLKLNGNNAFTGVININGGELILNGTNTASQNIVVGSSALALIGSTTMTGASQITVAANGMITLVRPDTVVKGGSLTPIALSSGANVLAVVGPGAFTLEEFAALPTLPTISGGANANFGISTSLGDVVWDGPLTGTRRFFKGGNTLTLVGSKTDTGGVGVAGGTLKILAISNGGVPSPIGSSTNAATNLVLSGGKLMYSGNTVTTDRLFSFSTSAAIDSSGLGPITFSNTGLNTATGTASARTITLTGHNTGDNTIAGVIPNSNASNLTNVTKLGSGKWVLSGANTYTGATRTNIGDLVLDYATADPVNGAVQTNGGSVTFKKGNFAGSDTISSLQPGLNAHAQATLKVEGGFTLTATSFSGSGQAQRFDLFDVSGVGNSIRIGALANNNTSMVNGILMANAATPANGRANMIIRDADGSYGWPAWSGVANAPILKATGLTDVAPGTVSFASNTTNYLLDEEGTYTSNTDVTFSTITIDTNDGPITFHLSGNGASATRLNPNGSGKGMLFTGSNDAVLSGFNDLSSGVVATPVWFHNYLDDPSILTITPSFGRSNFMIFGGKGYTVYSGSGFTQNCFIHGHTLRADRTQFMDVYPGYENFRVSTGGVFEIGGDFNSTLYEPDFSKEVTNLAGGVCFYGDSGVSAYAIPGEMLTKRIIDFSTAAIPPFEYDPVLISQNLIWGGGRFLTVEDSDVDADATFKLSSIHANVTAEIRNNIDLNGRDRVVDVANGTADVDADLAGVLSGGGAAGIVKKGLGTLALSGVNSYKGETRVIAGTVRVEADSLDPLSSVRLDGGKIHVTGVVHVNGVTINGIPKGFGTVSDANVIGPGSLFNDSTTGLTPYEQWTVDTNIGAGETAPEFDADFDGLKNLLEYAVGSNPEASTASVLSVVKNGGASPVLTFKHAAGRTDLTTFVIESSLDLGTTWTVIATSTNGGAFVPIASVTAPESAGTVTVTDNRAAPVGGKLFYRLRADK